MKNQTTDIRVLRAIKEKKIDLLQFTEGSLQDFYAEKAKQSLAICAIDLNWVVDKDLLQYIVDFFFDMCNREELTHMSFHQIYALQAAKLSQGNLDGTLSGALSYCGQAHHRGNFRTFCNSFLHFYETHKHADPFDNDIWLISWFNLSSDRINPTNPLHYLSFSDISREDTKFYIKTYIKYTLELTGLSVSSIFGKIRFLSSACNLIDKSPIDFIRSDAQAVLSQIRVGVKAETYNEKVRALKFFFDYLVSSDYISANPFSFEDTVKQRRKYIRNSVDSSVIRRIFDCLDKFENKELALMFLIEYCTGMRVSEVCQLKRNCLERTAQGFFIKFYSQKMKKEVSNVIPENLYLMINQHIANIRDAQQEFLFVAPTAGGPYRSGSLRKAMNAELAKFNIENPDGAPYVYKPHSYRHTMGRKMRELNIPFQFIQEQLHHESPDMTMNYVEYLDKEKVKKYDEFINVSGEIAPVTSDIRLDNEIAHAEYMRKFINAQMLPNGVCARPVKLGGCPHCNSCLTCSEFRTSIKDLEVHKNHLARIEGYISVAESNGWLPQLETSRATRDNLLKIIAKLESMSSGTECA